MKCFLKIFVVLCLALAASANVAWAQASGSTAELRGQVADANGAAIPNAKLTLTDTAKGTARTGVSDAAGAYVFIGLLPSVYELKTEAANFTSGLTRLELTVGQLGVADVTLKAGGLTEQIEVVAGTEVVETARTEQSAVIDNKQIANLPINRRNFLDYALLTPGVVDADSIADSSDFRVGQTPQSGLSFGGNNGRGNMVQVDGAETLGSSGGVQATISQEAVQEFQVVRNSYSAEFGGAAGGIVNIISKSGANRYFGSAFGLFRDKSLDARNAFDFNPQGQSPFNRQQYGGSFGGALKQDKTFFFSALERLRQKRTVFLNLNDTSQFDLNANSTNPTVRLQATLFDFLASSAATPAALRPVVAPLRAALTTTNYARTLQLFSQASGQFPFKESQTQFSTRLDHNFSDKSTGYARINFTDGVFENQAAGSLTAVSRGRKFDGFNGGIVLSHNYQLSSTTLNELKLQFSHTRSTFAANDPNGPEINIEGFGFFGRDIFLPSKTIERHYDVYDNFSKITGKHSFKFGGSAFIHDISSSSDTFFGGRFNFGAAIPLSNIIALNPALGPAVATGLSQFLQAANPALLPALATPITALQSYNLGLPIVYQQGFGDPSADSWTNRYGFYAQDAWQLASNFTLNYGLRYSLHDEPFFVPTYKRDWQPRASFAWDPFKNGKTVVRGGGGIFIGFLNNAVANVTTELSGRGEPGNINIVLATATSNALGLPTSFTVYQTLLARGVIGQRPIALSDITAAPISLTPGAGRPLEVRFRLGPDYRNPTTYQASFGVQRDLGKGFSGDVNYLYVRGLHVTRNRDINQFKTSGPVNPLNPDGGATFVRFPAAGQTTDFLSPARLQDNVYETTANSFYHALTMQVQKRFATRFSLNAHYTLSRAVDEVTDYNSDFSAQNPLNLRLDRALSAFDQRHRFVASGVLQSPFENPFAKDWSLAPIFVAQSGRPVNLLLGFDANADGRSQSDRPGQAGRNTARSEAFYSFDMRLARRFLVKENRFLEFTMEGFNLFNRTNLLGINNTLGAACTTADGARFAPCTAAGAVRITNFSLGGRRDRKPTEPLGFTSAADARQFQLGVRFNF